MDIKEMKDQNNKQTSQVIAMLGAGLKNGFQYMTRFPGNAFRSRKEFKEAGEEYKLLDIFSKAHEKTAETIDFEADYELMYSKTLEFLRSKDKIDQKALAAHGIDEDVIINGIKHYSEKIRYSRVGVTVENSIRKLAEKINDRLEKFIDGTSDGKSFDESLKQGAPTQEQQEDFAQKFQKAEEKKLDGKQGLAGEKSFEDK